VCAGGMSVRIDCERADYVSFTILNFDENFPGYPALDCRALLHTHSQQHKKKNEEKEKESGVQEKNPSSVENLITTTTTATAAAAVEVVPSEEKENNVEKDEMALSISPDLSLGPTLKRNRYDNIIERLERKYCGSTAVTQSESTDDDEAEELPQPTRRKKRAAVGSDYYDMDDPFIDDADNIASVESQIKMSQIQTKHDGYFVSSGVLELSAASSSAVKLISESQREEAMATINSTFPDIASKLGSIWESLVHLKSLNEITSTSKKAFPPSLLTEFIELDSLALSHDIDLCRQLLVSKTKSPYRLWFNYFFQNLCKQSSDEIVTEEALEASQQILRKQILKKRTSLPSSGTGKESGGNNLREILDRKVQEVGAKIRSQIEERSSEEKRDSTGE
jgi:hypothetical protein